MGQILVSAESFSYIFILAENDANSPILVSAESFSYILVSAESDAIHSAANRSENSGFVQYSDQLLQIVRKWSEN